jgi:hypothetical protein
MDHTPVIMSDIKVAVDAILRIIALCIEKMGIPTFDRQGGRKKVRVTFKTGIYINKTSGIFGKVFFLPVNFSAVFEQIPVNILKTMSCLGKKVTGAFGRQMTFNTMNNIACGIIIMRRQFPALIGIGMNMT